MKTFKRFIAESKWDKYVYHATYNKDFAPHAGMHVGTLHAAMARAYATRSDAYNPKTGSEATNLKDLQVHAYKYKPSGKSLRVHDPEEGNATDELEEKGHITPYWKKYPHGTMKHGTVEVSGHEHVQQELKRKGVSHLTYKNEIEDPGSKSHIIYDPENLRPVKTFKNPKFIHRQYFNNERPKSKESWRMAYPYFSRTAKERKVK